MAQKASFFYLLQKLDRDLGRLEEALDDNVKNVRDFESYEDLLDELGSNLRETEGEDDDSFGFMLALLGPVRK
jgi:hypothetical protein